MDTIERVRRHHQILRGKLAVLESALRMGPEAWFVLRELCHSASRQLTEHIRQEEQLIAECQSGMSADMVDQLSLEHRRDLARLQTINHLFLEERSQSLGQIRPLLTQCIQRLSRHMEEEEAMVFPALEQRLGGANEVATQQAAGLPDLLVETRTVNHVLRQHPSTKTVFAELFINVSLDGCDCLDEVAWRHGMESGELIAKLEHAIRSGAETSAEPADHPACSCVVPQSKEGADAESCTVGA